MWLAGLASPGLRTQRLFGSLLRSDSPCLQVLGLQMCFTAHTQSTREREADAPRGFRVGSHLSLGTTLILWNTGAVFQKYLVRNRSDPLRAGMEAALSFQIVNVGLNPPCDCVLW